jgi:hypothetical protein
VEANNSQESKTIFSNLIPSNSHKVIAAGGFGSILRQDVSVFNDVV